MNGRQDTSPAPLRPPPNPALPYREDCWSEGETSALVDAWGERYVDLNRGNLRQKHWQEVADAVNARRGATGRRPPRTDVQCKNRIDTLKKKYKIEKARIGTGESASPSKWPFYSRLDALIGSSAPLASAKKPSASVPLALPLPFHRKGSPLPTATAAVAAAAAAAAAAVRPVEEKKRLAPAPATVLPVDDFYRRAAAAAAAAEEDDDDDEDDLEESLSPPSGYSSRSGRKACSSKSVEGEGVAIRQLAGAIRRFAEIYERVESSKQRQMMELEKQRMEFAKALEFQRMQLFVDSQVQLEKIKRPKLSDPGNYL